MNQEKGLRLQSQSLFLKNRAWDCNLKPFLGPFLWPGAGRDITNLCRLYFAIVYYKPANDDTTICACCDADIWTPFTRCFRSCYLDCPSDLSPRQLKNTGPTSCLFQRFWAICLFRSWYLDPRLPSWKGGLGGVQMSVRQGSRYRLWNEVEKPPSEEWSKYQAL